MRRCAIITQVSYNSHDNNCPKRLEACNVRGWKLGDVQLRPPSGRRDRLSHSVRGPRVSSMLGDGAGADQFDGAGVPGVGAPLASCGRSVQAALAGMAIWPQAATTRAHQGSAEFALLPPVALITAARHALDTLPTAQASLCSRPHGAVLSGATQQIKSAGAFSDAGASDGDTPHQARGCLELASAAAPSNHGVGPNRALL